ncbi:RBM15 [Lepeophtheirus salmonis]|uniref:RBM15 n=1 Tax=Lepeophtheirus salmonis TaxID=72036 RepID=A0A7R8CL89_LEPSM|nr:RBM15 [Lepeophtheirus salmonis]CAF2826210.1 RBM15 [Lepeophtheirus salmonis]
MVRKVNAILFANVVVGGMCECLVIMTTVNHNEVVLFEVEVESGSGNLSIVAMSSSGGRSGGSGSRGGYKVLCVSCLHPKASDDVIRESLYREYNKKYGDVSVRVMHEPDERVAYVYFRNFDDARDAKHAKSRIILFDKAAVVEPVYENRRRSPSPPPSSMLGPPPPYYRYRSRSPMMEGGPHGAPPSRLQRQPRYPYSEAHHRRYTKDNRPGADPHTPPHHHHHHHHHHVPPPPVPNKKDKFPNYLNHIPPEEDPLATRTLFTGNLELNITEEEMRRIFGRYGKLVDIDIKRPPPGTAHRAKIELSGQYIGKFQCKIGYGKVNPTPKVWIGGLGSWASTLLLESEFDRFGAIQKVDFRKGDPHAYIFFESIEAAQAAVQEMRGYPLGGQDKRLRMDFADIEESSGGSSSAPPIATTPVQDRYRDYHSFRDRNYTPRRAPPPYSSPSDWPSGGTKRSIDDLDSDHHRPSRIRRVGSSPEPGEDRRISGDEEDNPRRSCYDGNDDSGGVRSLVEITKKTPNVWDGGLILKNSLFPTKFYLIEGNEDVGKLDDVAKRMKTSSSHAIFLGVSDSTELTHENPDIQSRPLRNLVTYLKQKEAAGVISLNNKDEGSSGVLYCFPPCPFSLDLLRSEFNNIDEGYIRSDKK